MTKLDLARDIANQTGLSQSQILDIIDRIFDGIGEGLRQEGRIELRDFGVFEVRRRRARWARNPRTGERIPVPDQIVATFKPGKALRQQVEQFGREQGPATS